MAGLAPISMQRWEPGARAQFLAADTLNPIAVWQDYGLSVPHPNPVVTDAYGTFPPIFIDEELGFYRVRITDSSGVILFDLTTLPVIGPSGGGGVEVPVDPNALFKTGFPIWIPVSGSLAGFVRMNGRTIGSATSGATERANSDCEALFAYNWSNYSNTQCPVSGGRGVSSAADWAANKTIGLLNMQNKGPFGLDDMGAVAAGGFAGVTFDIGNATTAASTGGDAVVALTPGQLPAHLHAQTAQQPTFTYNRNELQDTGGGAEVVTGITATGGTNPITTTGDATPGDTANTGNGESHLNMPPFMLGTWYVKL